nr:MAG TPA: ryanodine receptor [Caudoviricetes sp.]
MILIKFITYNFKILRIAFYLLALSINLSFKNKM